MLQGAVGAATRDARSLLVVAKQVLVLQTAVGVGAALACALALPTAVGLFFAGEVGGFATSSAAACVVLFSRCRVPPACCSSRESAFPGSVSAQESQPLPHLPCWRFFPAA